MGAIDHVTFGLTCHTALPYTLVRTSLRKQPGEPAQSPAEHQVQAGVRTRVRFWKVVQPLLTGANDSRGTESALNALILTLYDAPTGKLSADTRLTFETMWQRQIAAGDRAHTWPWFGDVGGEQPWEAFDSQYWGAPMAAVDAGVAPAGYRAVPQIHANLRPMARTVRRAPPVLRR